jgi:hypothetical protein
MAPYLQKYKLAVVYTDQTLSAASLQNHHATYPIAVSEGEEPATLESSSGTSR